MNIIVPSTESAPDGGGSTDSLDHPGETPGPPPPERRRRRPIILTAAAGVVAAGVTALLITIAGRGDPTSPAAASPPPSPSPSPSVPGAVADLEARARPFEVTLRWGAPSAGATADTYGVYRDGTLLENLEAGSSTFVDTTALPEQEYEYSVRTLSKGVSSEDATVDVETPAAPLALARVAGTYDIRARTTSKSGYSDYPDELTSAWSFKPRCKEGACGVAWRDLANRDEPVRLERKGAAYRGSGSSHGFIECRGVAGTSSVEIALKVEKAEVIGGRWTATRLTGTLRHDESPQLGCRSSSAELAIRATRVRR